MIPSLKTYCPSCDQEVDAGTRHVVDQMTVRNERVEYLRKTAVCPLCKKPIYDARIENDNINAAYTAYCKRRGIMSPNEIKALRNRYNLSLREFSKFLGFGEQTVARYETGSIPDSTHNYTLKTACTPQGASDLLATNRHNLSESSIEKIESFIQGKAPRRIVISCIPQDEAPSEINGYRPFDFRRVKALARKLAEKCTELYKTKLQKAMFLCDFASYEISGKSMTGLTYAHADFGPIMNRKDEIMFRLQDSGVITSQEYGWGEIVLPGTAVEDVFSDDESRIINAVALFVNKFDSATKLSEFSHSLTAWKDTNSGQKIPYGSGYGEVTKVIEIL